MILKKTILIFSILILTTNINAKIDTNPTTLKKCDLEYTLCLQSCDIKEDSTEECYQKCDIKLSECEETVEANK